MTKSLVHTSSPFKMSSPGCDDGAIILAEGFKFNCPLKELDLSGNNITTAGATAIMHYACPLRNLTFSDNDIGDDGAKEVADKLKYKS